MPMWKLDLMGLCFGPADDLATDLATSARLMELTTSRPDLSATTRSTANGLREARLGCETLGQAVAAFAVPDDTAAYEARRWRGPDL